MTIVVLGGCTIIRIDGPARVTMAGFGVLRIEPATPHAIVYRSMGFGLVPGRDGATIGYRAETAALIVDPHDCRIVLFNPSAADAEALRAALAPVTPAFGDPCILGEGH